MARGVAGGRRRGRDRRRAGLRVARRGDVVLAERGGSSCSTTASTCSTPPARSPPRSASPRRLVVHRRDQPRAARAAPASTSSCSIRSHCRLRAGPTPSASPSVELFLERARAAGAVLEPDARRARPTSPSCAGDSTVCRWRSSWPPPGPARSRPATCWRRRPAARPAAARPRRRRPPRLDARRDRSVDVTAGARSERRSSGGSACSPDRSTSGSPTAVAGEADDEPPDLARPCSPGSSSGRSSIAETHGSATRYRLLELLREHAVDELAAAASARRAGALRRRRWSPSPTRIVVQRPRAVGPGAARRGEQRSSPTSSRACELCLERDARPDRAYRLLLPMFAAVHEGRAGRGAGARPSGARALGRRRRAVADRGVGRAGDRRRDRRPQRRRRAARRGRRRRPGRQRRRRRAGRPGVGAGRARRSTRSPRHGTSSSARAAAERAGFAVDGA